MSVSPNGISKRHLNRFDHFCTAVHGCAMQIDNADWHHVTVTSVAVLAIGHIYASHAGDAAFYCMYNIWRPGSQEPSGLAELTIGSTDFVSACLLYLPITILTIFVIFRNGVTTGLVIRN